jgi:prevent-host-death family protein
MTRVSVAEVRKDLADTLNRVAFGGKRILLHRRGKAVAALVPLEDIELLERLEDLLDVKAALAAEADSEARGEKPIPWAKVRKKLGL